MSLTYRSDTRAVHLLIVLVAVGTGIALLPPVALGQEAPAEHPGLGECFSDPQGDERRLLNEQGGSPFDPGATEPADQDRADILAHCVNFGPTLSLTVRVDQPTDPDDDPNWDHATFVGWYLDVDNDGEGDYFVDYSLSREGELQARVVRLADEAETCTTAAAAFTGLEDREQGRFVATSIGRACFGNAERVAVQAGVFYDTSGEEGGGQVYTDASPDGGQFTPRVPQQGRGRARLAGANRMITSVEISRARFPDGDANVVYLARQDLFADAVAGGVLTDGPILLVPSCGTAPEEVRAEVERIDPDRVLSLGGPVAICHETLEETAGGRDIGRVAGEDRIETSIAISQREFPDPDDARFLFLARADVFADAVAGGVLTTGPILLVNPCGPAREDVQAEVERIGPERVIALGGIHAICDDTHDTAAGGRPQQRLFGPTRIETAIEISRFEFPHGAQHVHISRADLFADAVVGGILTDGPILLVPRCIEEPDHFPDEVGHEISRVSPRRLVALGGPHAICDPVVEQAADS